MIALDFETTGLVGPVALPLDKQPHIIEATLVMLDDLTLKEITRFTTLINPGKPQPKDLETSVPWAEVAVAKPFIAHYQKFCDLFIGQRTMVAHNCAFEASLIEVELKRIGKLLHFPWTPRRICTVEASFHIKNRRMKLGELYELASGKPIKGAHRTEADVDALVICLKWLKKKGYVT